MRILPSDFNELPIDCMELSNYEFVSSRICCMYSSIIEMATLNLAPETA